MSGKALQDKVQDLYEANYSHFDFIEVMNGGDCDCDLHKEIELEEESK